MTVPARSPLARRLRGQGASGLRALPLARSSRPERRATCRCRSAPDRHTGGVRGARAARTGLRPRPRSHDRARLPPRARPGRDARCRACTSACSTATARSRLAPTAASASSCAGLLREPMLRIDVRRRVGERELADRDRGRARLGRRAPAGCASAADSRIAWHDHRLAPPPASGPGRPGASPSRSAVDGRAGGDRRHVLPRRQAGRLALARWRRSRSRPGSCAAARRRPRPGRLTVGLGVAAGLAALARRDDVRRARRADGGVAWLQLVAAIARRRGRSRRAAAPCAAAPRARRGGRRGDRGRGEPQLAPGLLARRRHLGAARRRGARLACGLALAGGAAAAALSFLPEFDEPVRARVRGDRLLAAARARRGAADPSVAPIAGRARRRLHARPACVARVARSARSAAAARQDVPRSTSSSSPSARS